MWHETLVTIDEAVCKNAACLLTTKRQLLDFSLRDVYSLAEEPDFAICRINLPVFGK